MNPFNRLPQEYAGTEDFDLRNRFVWHEGHAVRNHQTTDWRFRDAWNRWSTQHTMRCSNMDLFGTIFVQDLGRTDNATTGTNHIVKHECNFAFDTGPDQIRLLRGFGIDATLIDDRQRCTQACGVAKCTLMLPSSALTTTASFLKSNPSVLK